MRSIDRFLQEVAATEKRAAEANTEPGSIGGPTEHPVKDVDDSTEDAKEGFRSSENESDVKADQGPPSVENTPDNIAAKKASAKRAVDGKSEAGSVNPPGTASEDQLQIGTKKEPTGQDPSVETSSVKAEKEDPASAGSGSVGHSSHPARTNNSELDGYKYAEMDLDKLAKVASDMGNNLLVKLSQEQSSGSKTAKKTVKKAETSCDDDDDDDDEYEMKEAADIAGQAGWELAGLLSGNFDKQAADSLVRNALEEIIKTASDDAEKVAEFLFSYQNEMSKKAMGEMPQGVDPAAMMGGEAGSDPAAMMGGGEEDPAAMMGGEEEMGGGGGDIEQLAAVLESLGISPEELEAAMAAQGGMGGEGGGMPPEAGGMPPEAGGMPLGDEEVAPEDTAGGSPGMEVEASYRRTKKTAAAKKGAAEKSTRDYIQEVLERSRR
jgi:hypothetical protein